MLEIMDEKEWLSKGLDKEVIPLVKFFNENGLPTLMSCQGHNQTNMSMFWIEFDKSVTEDDILNFMHHHPDKYGSFFSNGRFAKRIWGAHSIRDGEWNKVGCWCYFAATIEAANDDLQRWQNDAGVWKGIGGEDFQKLMELYMKREQGKS